MVLLTWITLLATVGTPNSAADAITLKDGSVVLGQVVEGTPNGKVVVVVRRAWAEKTLPLKYKIWKQAEDGSLLKAKTDRLRRLEEWHRDRNASPAEKDDTIGPWLTTEIERMKANADTLPLMRISLNKGDVKTVTRRNAETARKLRQAWRGQFDDAETKPVGELTSALEGRGFAMTDVDPAPIDAMLPPPTESENRWRARRAATEVQLDRGLRFIRAHGMIMPEATAGAAPDPKDLLGGLIKSQLGNADSDPLAGSMKQVAEKGRVGMLVTRLDTDDDLGGVKLEIVLCVKIADNHWEPAIHKISSVRASDVKPGDGAGIAEDPQVKSIFQGIEGLGIELPAELKQNSLLIGAATQKAIAQARTSIQPELDALAFPIK